MQKMFNLIKLAIPLYGERKHHNNNIKRFVDDKRIKKLLKLNKIGVSYKKLSTNLVKTNGWPQINMLYEDKEIEVLINHLNKEIKIKHEEIAFEKFSKKAKNIVKHISPGILGMNNIKKAVFLQLFSVHRVHILLLGDPAVGKTEILRSIDILAPKASFGLGSGVSKAGLTLSFAGKKIIPGLLPMANKGIACIDELNLMKSRDRGGLLNAMEKGFVTYDKGVQHQKLEADVRILATANPKTDRFVSDRLKMIREQLPFGNALMSRFHLVYIVRKPDIQQFLAITKSLLDKKKRINFDDVYFIRNYINYASDIEVEFPKTLEPMLLNFVEDIKIDEKKFLQEISPRMIKGFIAMIKAKARSELRNKVIEEDLLYVFRTVKDCLYRNF